MRNRSCSLTRSFERSEQMLMPPRISRSGGRMQKNVVSVLVLLASAFILSAADVTGTWKGTFTPDGREAGPALVILKQTGDTLAGTAGPDESDRLEIENGKV